MKKTSFIILTLVASVSITLGSATSSSAQDPTPPEYLYESDLLKGDTTRLDTIRTDSVRRDTVGNYFTDTNVYYYNYYYRSPFWNNMFRFCFPRRYYHAINTPGFVPRHLRSGDRSLARTDGKRPIRGGSTRRGGFGQLGSHSTSN